MKIKVNGSSIQEMTRKIQKAKQDLMKYDKEKVDYVRQCQDDIMQAISDSYREDESGDLYEEPVGPKLSEIKRDYLVGAIEDDLMTEEEFDEIFDALDVLDLELAHAQASTDVSSKRSIRASYINSDSDDDVKLNIMDYFMDNDVMVEGYSLKYIFDSIMDSPYSIEDITYTANSQNCTLLQAIDILNGAY